MKLATVLLVAFACIVVGLAIGFYLGLTTGANAEQKRYLARYPKLGRLRITPNNQFKLDFGIDPHDLRNYNGCLLDISVLNESMETIDMSKMEEDEMLETLRGAEKARDALKT